MKYPPADYAKTIIEIEKIPDINLREKIAKKIKEILEKNGDLASIKEIETIYKELKLKTGDKTEVIIEYAGEIDKTAIQKSFSPKTEFIFKENLDLKAGIKIRINDFQIDNSARKRLADLQEVIA